MLKHLSVALLSIVTTCGDADPSERAASAHRGAAGQPAEGQRSPQAQPAMRTVAYRRHEFHHPPSDHRASLLAFVYDVPTLPACGVLPPFRMLNQILAEGGSDGGMSPGATWEPFQITADEYRALLAAIRDTPVESLRAQARYASVPLSVDPEFDGITDRFEWIMAVCRKHRESWFPRVEAASG
jgi:hypothetical protein